MKKYLAFGEVIETDINFDDILPISAAQTTLVIVEKPFPEIATKPTKVYRLGVQAGFAQLTDFDVLVWVGIVKYRISDSEINYQLLGANANELRMFTLSEALGIVLFRRKSFLLHGCSVVIQDAVHVFIGEPGAGKSTTATAFWQAGCTVLSDDLTAVKFIDNTPVVHAGIPTIKVWEDALRGLGISTNHLKKSVEGRTKYVIQQDVSAFPSTHYPLLSITYLLEPNTVVSNSDVPKTEVPIALLKHFPLPDSLLRGEALKRHFEQSITLANKVSVVYATRTASFAELKAYISQKIG